MPEKPEPITISFESTDAMRQWLEANYETTVGILLKIAKKGAPVTTVNYQQALEVALCFGWIDGKVNKLDDHFYLQKFTPRRKRSLWSKRNVNIAERLMAEEKMHPAGLAEIELAKADGRWSVAYDSPSKMTIPDDFMAALSENKQALHFFQSLDKTNLFSLGFRLQTAKSPETRTRRIQEIIQMLEKKEKFH